MMQLELFLTYILNQLTRALPPDIDQRLQERLSRIDHEIALAFLLMRKTGLRISELCDLSFEPMTTHRDGYYYLNVKPSKVFFEPLVPLDSETVQLAHQIQKKTQAKVSYSILNNFNHLLINRELKPHTQTTMLMRFRNLQQRFETRRGELSPAP